MVAQLDRVTDYESVGRGFESLPSHQKMPMKKVDVDALNKVLTELPALMDTVNSLQTQVQNISNWFSSLGSVFGR